MAVTLADLIVSLEARSETADHEYKLSSIHEGECLLPKHSKSVSLRTGEMAMR
jgi:hypothetical protein